MIGNHIQLSLLVLKKLCIGFQPLALCRFNIGKRYTYPYFPSILLDGEIEGLAAVTLFFDYGL